MDMLSGGCFLTIESKQAREVTVRLRAGLSSGDPRNIGVQLPHSPTRVPETVTPSPLSSLLRPIATSTYITQHHVPSHDNTKITRRGPTHRLQAIREWRCAIVEPADRLLVEREGMSVTCPYRSDTDCPAAAQGSEAKVAHFRVSLHMLLT